MSTDQPVRAGGHRGRRVSSRAVAAILRSPLHRLLDGRLAALTFTGRHSGRTITLPVQFARDADDLVVFVAHHRDKQWWRNFRTASPVTVRLRGRDHAGIARVVTADRHTRDAYDHRYPRAVGLVASEHVPLFVRVEQLRPDVPDASGGEHA